MFKAIKNALIRRRLRKLPLVVQRDIAIGASIEHILDDGCLCLANHAIKHPCEAQSNAIMDLFEHITPLEINRASREISKHIVRDDQVAIKNLKEFSKEYDCMFSRWWTEGQGRTLEELDSSLEA